MSKARFPRLGTQGQYRMTAAKTRCCLHADSSPYLQHLVYQGVVVRLPKNRPQVVARDESRAVNVQPLERVFQALLLSNPTVWGRG